MKRTIPLLAAAMLLPAAPVSLAQVLLMDAIAEAPVNSAEGLPRPSRGASMDQVRSRFGEPDQELPWVGEPPISRWVYPDFTVYFEKEQECRYLVKDFGTSQSPKSTRQRDSRYCPDRPALITTPSRTLQQS
ncbi:MAG: hypothetical protein B0D82_02390, partial [Candidatus Sedimenticola endophacoides]